MAEEKVREVKGPGPGGRRGGPRPKVKNPMKLFSRIMGYIFKYYSVQMILVVVLSSSASLQMYREHCSPEHSSTVISSR